MARKEALVLNIVWDQHIATENCMPDFAYCFHWKCAFCEARKEFNHASKLKTFFLSQALVFLIVTGGTVAQDTDYAGTPMEPTERKAFYDVVGALNPDWDWRSMYPDPCGVNALQGTSCDEWGGYWYFTALSFGPVYDNTPACATNATIHSSISRLTHLKSLSFYQCFTGTNVTIPVELAGLNSSLEILTFRNNIALVGEIPAEFGGMWKLERLVMTGNSLEGAIPSELGELSRLLQLDLSRNMLQGAVPNALGYFPQIVVLDLSSNRLSYPIPSSLGTARTLEKIDLSRNELGGAIPDSIGCLTSLKLLDISYNELQGHLPTSFSSLTNLQELYLGNNELSGTIPDIWANLTKLISLDLSASAFDGAIPPSFGALRDIRYLSVRNNRLSGLIPRSLGNLASLYSLYLDDNQLSGPVPFSLGFLQRLGSNLVLGSNDGLYSVGDSGLSNMTSCPDLAPAAPQLSVTTDLANLMSGAGMESITGYAYLSSLLQIVYLLSFL